MAATLSLHEETKFAATPFSPYPLDLPIVGVIYFIRKSQSGWVTRAGRVGLWHMITWAKLSYTVRTTTTLEQGQACRKNTLYLNSVQIRFSLNFLRSISCFFRKKGKEKPGKYTSKRWVCANSTPNILPSENSKPYNIGKRENAAFTSSLKYIKERRGTNVREKLSIDFSACKQTGLLTVLQGSE